MATIDVPGFGADASALALRLVSSDLPGIFGKRLDVPDGAVAVVHAEGAPSPIVVKEKGSQSGSFRAVLVKTADLGLSFVCDGLRGRDARVLSASLELVVRLPQKPRDVAAFERSLLAQEPTLTTARLKERLEPGVRTALAGYALARDTAQLCDADHREGLFAALVHELGPIAFDTGIDLLGVRHAELSSSELAEARRAELSAEAEAEALRRSEQLQELRARLEKNERLQQQEVQELAKVLEYQGLLKEVALKQDIDRRRREEEVKRFEEVSKRVGNDDLKALIFLLDDERLKADLIRQLIERDMTEEQLRARRAVELEERLGTLAKRLGVEDGARQDRLRSGGFESRRIFVVLGKQALAFDPRTTHRRESPREIYDFEKGELGFLRSVRVAQTKLGPTVLCGAQGGVYATPHDGRAGGERKLRFSTAPKGQGGVNGVAFFNGYVYATHSEMGLHRFDFDGIVRPEALYPELTSAKDAVRGAHTTADGKLFFAAGTSVWRCDLVRPSVPPLELAGAGEPLTSFVVTRDEVFAGTQGGRVLRWALTDPRSPRELHVRKASSIYMLKVAEVLGEPHLLVGAKEHGVTAISVESGRSLDFRAPDAVRWVDGASDFVVGVTRGGYAAHVWRADAPERVAFTLHLADRVQDLFLEKAPIEKASLDKGLAAAT